MVMAAQWCHAQPPALLCLGSKSTEHDPNSQPGTSKAGVGASEALEKDVEAVGLGAEIASAEGQGQNSEAQHP